MPASRHHWLWLPAIAAAFVLLVWSTGRRSVNGHAPLVVYCSHDAVYAESILRQFEQELGIPVEVRFDTEATKSLGLINLLLQERERPRCDVFWNNELLGMLHLQSEGVLEPYRGAGWKRIPEQYRDPEGDWTGFGARLRVWIVNTRLLPEAAEASLDQLWTDNPRTLAVAKPLYGTTLTQYSLLWKLWGPDKLKAWHHDVRERGVREVNGNGLVKDMVAAGTCTAGWTDTDDTFAALETGAPVRMLPLKVEGRTIVIPNTVAIIRGTSRRGDAELLVDYLLSAQTELALARSTARQIPLGEVPESDVPAEVRELLPWAAEGHDLRDLLPDRDACLAWLKSEYLE